jgi:hypothetical protein
MKPSFIQCKSSVFTHCNPSCKFFVYVIVDYYGSHFASFVVQRIKITLCLTILFVESSTLYLREWDACICCSREGRSVRGRSISSFKKQTPPLFHILSCIKSAKIFLLGHFSFSASTGHHSRLSIQNTSARERFRIYLKLYGLLIYVCKRILYQTSLTEFLITQSLILLLLSRTNTVQCPPVTPLSVLHC